MLEPGNKLKQAGMVNRDIADYYKSRNIHPSTYRGDRRLLGGIGYMNVEGNFIVS
jgi:hypothetical protein